MPELIGKRTPVVAILLPSRGSNPSEFTFDFAHLVALTCMGPVNDEIYDFRILRRGGTYIDMNRCDLVKDALRDDAVTHFFWLDDDMHFPPTALIHLMNRNLPFVGANYSRRRMPLEPVAIKHTGDATNPGKKCETKKHSTGVEPVAAVGFGCVLIQRKVFEAIPYPWFQTRWEPERKRWVGEDVYFCLQAAAAGFPPVVDHDLSHEIAHHGTMAYTLDHARAYKRGRDEVLDLAGMQD